MATSAGVREVAAAAMAGDVLGRAARIRWCWSIHTRCSHTSCSTPASWCTPRVRIPRRCGRRSIGVRARLDRTPLADPATSRSVIMCDSRWLFALFARTHYRVGGIADVFVGQHVFLRESDMEHDRLIGPGGQPVASESAAVLFHRARADARRPRTAPRPIGLREVAAMGRRGTPTTSRATSTSPRRCAPSRGEQRRWIRRDPACISGFTLWSCTSWTRRESHRRSCSSIRPRATRSSTSFAALVRLVSSQREPERTENPRTENREPRTLEPENLKNPRTLKSWSTAGKRDDVHRLTHADRAAARTALGVSP